VTNVKNRFKKITIIIQTAVLTLVFLGCSKQEITSDDIRTGVYAWEEQNILKLYYYHYIENTSFEIGDTLTLLNKVDFKYTNCGFFGFGDYTIEGDSLYLNFDSTATHNDSLLTYDNFTDVYYIENENTLSSKFRSKSTSDGVFDSYGISELHFVKDSLDN